MTINVRQCSIFIVCLGIALLPIMSTTTLPLYDYPNHLARMHVLANWETSKLLQQFYVVDWRSIPNLAMDLIVPSLSLIIGLEAAGKAYIALTFLAIAGGVALVHHSFHGHWSAYSLIAFIFLYNGSLIYGFMNYLFSVGIFLVVFASWVRLSDWSWSRRLVLFSASSIVLFYAHLYGLGLYGVTVVLYEASKSWSALRKGERFLTRDWIATLGQFVLPFLLFICISPTSEAASQTSWDNLINIWHYYGKVWLVSNLFDNYHEHFDWLCVGMLAVAVVGGLAFRRITFSPHTLVPFLGLSFAYILMPKTFFSSWAADEKCTIALALFFISVTTFRPRRPIIDKLFAVGFAGMFLVRIGIVADTWHSYDEIYKGYRTAISQLPEGARLTAAIAYRGRARLVMRPPLNHLGNLIVIERDGFYPTIFAFTSQQPIRLKPPYDELVTRYRDVRFRNEELSSDSLSRRRNPFAPDLLRQFDYILIVRETLFDVALPSSLIPIYVGADFTLYRING